MRYPMSPICNLSRRASRLAGLAGVLTLAAGASIASAQTNQIVNPGFEQGIGDDDGWPIFASGGGFTATSTSGQIAARTGSRELALGNLSGQNQFIGVFQTVPVSPGDAVEWGLYATRTSIFRDQLEYRVEFSDSSGDLVAGQFDNNVNVTGGLVAGAYTRFTNSATAPPGATRASLVIAVQSFDGGGEGGLAGVDDVFLTVQDGGTTPPGPIDGDEGPTPPDNYELWWADEFDGGAADPDPNTGVDRANWEFQLGNGCPELCTWGNGEIQSYTQSSSNIRVESGLLRITARRSGNTFTSARIRSIDRVTFRYGQIDVRMRVPKTPGAWPAAWLLFDPIADQNPNSAGTGVYGGWAASGEIDIFESRDADNIVHGTIHYGGEFPGNTLSGGTVNPPFDISAGFNTYTVRWTPDELIWYLNGAEYYCRNRGQWSSTPRGESGPTDNPRAPFDQPFYLLLNLAVDGQFPRQSAFDGAWPQTLDVHYVRVYRLRQTPFGGEPAQLPGSIEAEEFDIGYPGEAFSDSDVDNTLGDQRPDADVEIEALPGAGLAVFSDTAGEWTEYTVTAEKAGTYYIQAEAGVSSGGVGTLEIAREGGPVATLTVRGTPSPAARPTLALDEGEQILRVRNVSSDVVIPVPGNDIVFFSRVTLDSLSLTCNPADIAAPFGEFDAADAQRALDVFLNGVPVPGFSGDLTGDGNADFLDIIEFLAVGAAGCP